MWLSIFREMNQRRILIMSKSYNLIEAENGFILNKQVGEMDNQTVFEGKEEALSKALFEIAESIFPGTLKLTADIKE